MQIPNEVAVMTLPEATLFPQATLPLKIFEPRYRLMLEDALSTHRMFIVAMQKQGAKREIPSPVAGLGVIRVCVENPDGSSHLILQGLTRVALETVVRVRPYRIHRIRALQAPPRDSVAIDALVAKVRDLVAERIQLGHPLQPQIPSPLSLREIFKFLDKIDDPDQVADVISCALLPRSAQRQTILETIEVEPRLKHLIHFLMAEIIERRKNKSHE